MSALMTLLVTLLAGGFAFLVVYYVSARVTHEVATLKATAQKEKQPAKRGWFVDAWRRRVDPFVPKSVGDGIGKQIVMAGGLEGLTAAELFLYVTLAALVGLTLSIWISLMTGWSAWTVVLGCLLGAVYPFIWLRDQVKKRHNEIQRDLPYHIDLLTLCVEAGLDFGAGVARTVEKGKPGPLRDELMTFLAEVRVGKTRAEALEAMSNRVGLIALSNFLAALIQADRMGSGLGRTLRLQAEQLRNDRFQRAEQLAGEAPVKIILPLVLFIFPTIWIILAAPLVFEWLFRGGP
jgi:tight adherence protein C